MARSNRSVGLFGGLSDLSACTAEALIAGGLPPKFAVLHAYGPAERDDNDRFASLIANSQPEIVRLCERHDIPVHFHAGDEKELRNFLLRQNAGIYFLSCYPAPLPDSVIALAKTDCVNAHPSLLPKYRGANPIFWQLRRGEKRTGVTLHRVTAAIDAGDILAASELSFEAGMRIHEIHRLASIAAVSMLKSLASSSRQSWVARAQNHGQATWQASPCDDDYVIGANESAGSAFRFIRAYADQDLPLAVESRSRTYHVADALFCSTIHELSPNRRLAADQIRIDFSDGFVDFSLRRND